MARPAGDSPHADDGRDADGHDADGRDADGRDADESGRHRTTGQRVLALLGFVLVAVLAGLIGNLLQGDDVGTRYLQLERPGWAPPQDAFGIVWPVLYVLIAIAAWRVWDVAGGLRAATAPLGLWLAQLAVNAIWPGVFFGMQEFGAAIAVIVLLDLLVVATLALFARWSRLAAFLLVPYLGWILYATALNVAIWQMN